MDRILRLPARGQPPHESLSSQPSHGHGKLVGKSAAEDRTVQAFPDLRVQNAIISDACGIGDRRGLMVSAPTAHRVDLGSIPSFGHFRIGQFFRKNRMLYNQKSGYYTSDDAGHPPTSVRVIAR